MFCFLSLVLAASPSKKGPGFIKWSRCRERVALWVRAHTVRVWLRQEQWPGKPTHKRNIWLFTYLALNCCSNRILHQRRNLEGEEQRKQEGEGRGRWSISFMILYAMLKISISSSFLKSHFVCWNAEGFIWLRFRLRVREKSSGQWLRGREASSGSVRLWVPIWLQVWIGVRSPSS